MLGYARFEFGIVVRGFPQQLHQFKIGWWRVECGRELVADAVETARRFTDIETEHRRTSPIKDAHSC